MLYSFIAICPSDVILKSKYIAGYIKIRMLNKADVQVNIYWVTYGGALSLKGTVAANETFQYNSLGDNVWIAAKTNGGQRLPIDGECEFKVNASPSSQSSTITAY